LQDELARSEEDHRLLAESATDMITRLGPDFRQVYISPSCIDLLGYAPEELLGHTSACIVHPDDLTLLDATLNAPLRAGQERARATYRAIRKDGTSVWLESSGRRLAAGTGYVMVTRDVTERRAFEEKLEAANRQLEDLAALDPLTGLANRRRFEELLQTEHRRARRLRLPLSIATIDVDQFKAYNDTYGHPAGDACLRAIAAAIDGVLRRPGDLAARIGGEEFSVLLPNTDASGASHMAERIRGAVLSLAMQHLESQTRTVTVSIGVTTALPTDDRCLTVLIKDADDALYAAKRSGRNVVRSASVLDPKGAI
jgi:diguanylate cyclase (GGDEF)-like protein/PAS domain S-box-containing protein